MYDSSERNVDPGFQRVLSARERAFGRALAGDFQGAREEIKAHLCGAPSDGGAHHLLAVALVHTGDLPGAIEAFRAAVRNGHDDASLRSKLGLG